MTARDFRTGCDRLVMNTQQLDSPASPLASLFVVPEKVTSKINTTDPRAVNKIVLTTLQPPTIDAKSENPAREGAVSKNVSPPHRLQSAVLKLPRNCTEIRRFIGRKEQLTGLVNEKYWGKKIEELDRSLAPFNERLVWATVLTFHSPAYRVGWNRNIACSARDEQNMFVATISHDFVFYSRGSAQRGTRLTQILINGHPVSLPYWLNMTAVARSKCWDACMKKVNPETGLVRPEVAGAILRTRLEEIDVKCAAVDRLLGKISIAEESNPSTPSIVDEVRHAMADLTAAREMLVSLSERPTPPQLS